MTELDDAVAALARGDLVVMPTDTVYGIGARPDVPGATARLFEAKHRPRDLTLPVLAASVEQAEEVGTLDGRARVLAERFWPGPLTIVAPRTTTSRSWDLGEERETAGVRIPNHSLALELLTETGPLAVTSANRSGEPTPPDCGSVRSIFEDRVAVYLCDDPRPVGPPSTVVDLTSAEPRVLRTGSLPASDVLAALADARG